MQESHYIFSTEEKLVGSVFSFRALGYKAFLLHKTVLAEDTLVTVTVGL